MKEGKKVLELKKKARGYSIKEGIFCSAKDSLGVQYVSPFAIAINSSSSLVALLSSIPGIINPISQVIGSKQIAYTPRKKIILKSAIREIFIWGFFILIGILFSTNILTSFLPLLVLFGYCIYEMLSGLIQPAWFSWTGDIIDEKHKGKWFSKRSLIMGAISLVFAAISALFLDFMKNSGRVMEGFIVLFGLALVFRIFSYNTFKKQYEPKIKIREADYFSFWEFLKKAPQTNFGKFSIYRGLIAFSSTISSSLLVVYLLRNLEFNYLEYILIIYAGTFFSLLFLELWGKLSDRYGNYLIIYITSIFLPAIPILWILHTSLAYLVIIPSFIGGISWAGFNLAAGNFIYDNVHPKKRGLAISYYHMLIGIGTFLGGGLSAFLIKYWEISLVEPIVAIFFLSAILRVIIVLSFLNRIEESKKMKKIKGLSELRNMVIHQARPVLMEEIHDIISIKKYLKK